MVAGVVPFRGPNFARELLLRRLEAEVRADRRPPHVVDVMRELHASHIVTRAPLVTFNSWRS